MTNTRFSVALYWLPLSLGMLGILHGAAAHAEAGGQSAYSKPGQPSTVGASGASGTTEKIAEANAQREQRRIELRAALLANKKKTDDAARVALSEYHLNAQELAGMRQQLSQQLRQERIGGENVKP